MKKNVYHHEVSAWMEHIFRLKFLTIGFIISQAAFIFLIISGSLFHLQRASLMSSFLMVYCSLGKPIAIPFITVCKREQVALSSLFVSEVLSLCKWNLQNRNFWNKSFWTLVLQVSFRCCRIFEPIVNSKIINCKTLFLWCGWALANTFNPIALCLS